MFARHCFADSHVDDFPAKVGDITNLEKNPRAPPSTTKKKVNQKSVDLANRMGVPLEYKTLRNLRM